MVMFVTNIYYTTANYRLTSEQVIVTKHFGIDNVTVTLEWIPVEEVTYNVSVVPQEEFPFALSISTWTQWQLILYYNIMYSVNIQASFCGYNNTTTLMLKYCEYTQCHNNIIVWPPTLY